MAKVVAFARLQAFADPGSMGVVKDTRFIFCYWPKLDRPTRIFADGSSGISVMGRTPRNVWFPDDVVFEDYVPDAEYPAEQAVLKASPGRRALVNLTDDETQIWLAAYEAAVKALPHTATVTSTQRAANFLRHREATGSEDKPRFEEYVAELTAIECADLVDGRVAEKDLRVAKEFVSLEDQAKRKQFADAIGAVRTR